MLKNIELPPEPYHSHLVSIPIEIIPVIIGALENRTREDTFSPESRYAGVQLIREAQVMILLGDRGVTEAINRVYRLLDTHLSGTIYTAMETDEDIIVTPPITDAPIAPAYTIHQRLERLEQLTDNAYNGTYYPVNGEDTQSIREILRAIAAQTDETEQLDTDQIAQLVQIAALLA